MYKKGPHNIHADVLARLRMLEEAAADDWSEIPSFRLSEQLLEHTKISPVANNAVSLKPRYKHTSRNTQLQRDEDATYDSTSLDDKGPNELLAAFSVLMFADLMFDPSRTRKWVLRSSAMLST